MLCISVRRAALIESYAFCSARLYAHAQESTGQAVPEPAEKQGGALSSETGFSAAE